MARNNDFIASNLSIVKNKQSSPEDPNYIIAKMGKTDR